MHFSIELDRIRFEFHQKKPKVHKKKQKVDSFFRNRNLYFHHFGLINEKLFIARPPSWCYRVQCGTQSNASGGSASDVPKITGRSQTYLQLLPSHNRSPGPGVSKVRCRHLRCTDRCQRISRPIVSVKRKWNRPLNRCFHFSTKSLKSRTKPPLEPSKCK